MMDDSGHVVDVARMLPYPDIRQSQFNNVIRFGIDPQDEIMEGESICSDAEENLDSVSKRSPTSAIQEQRPDINSQFLEQWEEEKVARLLQQVEELRMHQLQQQMDMMYRHQQQLKSLDDENHEQAKLVKQRQATWGGRPTNIATQPITMPNGPTNQKIGALSSAFPKVTGDASMMTSKGNVGPSISALVNLQSLGTFPVMVQKGRPLPVFHDTVPYSSGDDPEIESESCSVGSQSHIDGVFPLPDDSSSEISDVYKEQTTAETIASANSVKRNLNFDGSRNRSVNNKSVKGFEQINDGTAHQRLPNFQLDENSVEDKTAIPELRQYVLRTLQQSNMSLDRLVSEDVRYSGYHIPETERTVPMMNAGVVFENGNHELEEIEDEDDENAWNRDDTENPEQEVPIHGMSVIEEEPEFDEKPICGIGSRKKTFEELIEEELTKERQGSNTRVENGAAAVRKRTFLRKGEGLTKFVKPSTKEHNNKSSKDLAPGAAKHKKSTQKVSTQSDNVASGKGKLLKVQEAGMPQNRLQLKKPLQPSNSGVNSKFASDASGQKKPQSTAPAEPIQKKTLPVNNSSSRSKTTFAVSSTASSTAVGHPESFPSVVTAQSESNLKVDSTKLPSSISVTQPSASRNMLPGKTISDGLSNHPNLTSKIDSRLKFDQGDLSFQTNLQNAAQHEKVELEELQEFELLEQYAEDNASFLSNLSSVNRVLAQHKGTTRTQFHVDNGRRPLSSSVAEDNEQHSADDNSSVLSSSDEAETAVDGEESDDTGDASGLDVTIKDNAVLNASIDKLKPEHLTSEKTELRNEGQGIQRKIAAIKRHLAETQTSENNHRDLLGTTGQNSMSVNAVVSNSNAGFVSDEDETQHKRDDGAFDDVPQITNLPFARKTLQRPNADENSRTIHPVVRFDDDNSWDDDHRMLKSRTEEQEFRFGGLSSRAKDVPPLSSASSDDSDDDCQTKETVPPPTSKLVSKLFPKLKPNPPQSKPLPQQEEKLETVKQAQIGDGVQSKLLREKIAEMENEIQKFRNQNVALEKLRKEREEGLALLKKEMAEFEKQKQEELNRLQDFKSSEIKKLKKERKVFDQYQKSLREQPNKKEREEIEALKIQLAKLQEDLQKKEQRWTASTSRLRDRIEQLERDNQELKEENRLLEQRRLEAWQSKKVADSTAPSMTASLRVSTEADDSVASVVPNAAQLLSKMKQTIPATVVSTDFSHATAVSRSSAATSASGLITKDLKRHTLSAVKMDAVKAGEPVERLSSSSSHLMLSASPVGFPEIVEKPVAMKIGSTASSSNVPNSLDKGDNKYREVKHADGKVERVFTNGMREVNFPNGTRKQVSADGQSTIVFFFNGDIKRNLPDQRIIYYYADAQTTHTTYPDGLQILQFPNEHTEKHYPDGTKEICLPDHTVKYIFPSGVEESIFPDGTTVRVEKSGDTVMEFANGQREVHTKMYKRREYPDGTVKTVYADGRQETRYSSGRMRVKDKDGNILVDKQM